jgi:hypothetical protein
MISLFGKMCGLSCLIRVRPPKRSSVEAAPTASTFSFWEIIGLREFEHVRERAVKD